MFAETRGFGEEVSRFFNCGDVLKVDLIVGINFANVVESSINVLGSGMFDVVLNVFEGGFGVGAYGCRGLDFDADGAGEL